MEEEKIMNTLRSIGLNKNEVVVYLDLLSNNNSLSKDIVKRTKIHKANIYETLKTLILKGFVKEILKEDKRYFVALNPDILVKYLGDKQKEIKELIPMIPIFTNQGFDDEPELSLTKGTLSARNALLDLLDCGSEIIIYSIPNKILDELGTWFMDEFHKKRIKKKIPIRQLFDENFQERIQELNQLPHTEARHAGLSYSTSTFVSICGDIVITIVLTNPITVIKMKNKDIANSYRDYFEMIWKNSKKD